MESDTGIEAVIDDTAIITENQETKKTKRPMSDKQKESLAKARQLAWTKRRELGEVAGKERDLDKQLKLLALERRKSKVEKKLQKIKDDVPDYESSETESEDDVSIPVPKKKAVKAIPEMNEKQAISAEQARELLKQKILRESQRSAYASLFPGATTNPFA